MTCSIVLNAHKWERVWLRQLSALRFVLCALRDGCSIDKVRLSKLFLVLCYRMYAQRRVRDSFKESRRLNDHSDIERLYRQGLDSLDMLRRQVWLAPEHECCACLFMCSYTTSSLCRTLDGTSFLSLVLYFNQFCSYVT